MKRWKRVLAALMTTLMLTTALPPAVLAAPAEPSEEETGVLVPAPAEESTVPAEQEALDQVIYNLESMAVTVGTDADRAQTDPTQYKCFDADGSYTILLEDNAFFPYEVQFQYGGETFTAWFETPEDCVEVGGHPFYVRSESTDPTRLTQIGVTIGGEYIAAYPEPKEFTTEPKMALFSLLPLEEVLVYLDLTGRLPG